MYQRVDLARANGNQFMAGMIIAKTKEDQGSAKFTVMFVPNLHGINYETDIHECIYYEDESPATGWSWINMEGVIPEGAREVVFTIHSFAEARIGYIFLKIF